MVRRTLVVSVSRKVHGTWIFVESINQSMASPFCCFLLQNHIWLILQMQTNWSNDCFYPILLAFRKQNGKLLEVEGDRGEVGETAKTKEKIQS